MEISFTNFEFVIVPWIESCYLHCAWTPTPVVWINSMLCESQFCWLLCIYKKLNCMEILDMPRKLIAWATWLTLAVETIEIIGRFYSEFSFQYFVFHLALFIQYLQSIICIQHLIFLFTNKWYFSLNIFSLKLFLESNDLYFSS